MTVDERSSNAQGIPHSAVSQRGANTAVMKWIALPLLLSAGTAWGAMTLDGKLDEAEWAEATVFDDFRVVDPLTRQTPPYRTILRVLPQPDALYVSLWMEHPPAERTRGRSARDAETMDADVAQIVIDFEGQGRSAYEFTTSLSGSLRDSVILNQTEFVRDWDAIWSAAVHETEDAWTAEFAIPWSIARSGAASENVRTLGIWGSRYIKRTGERYAFPAQDINHATFIQNLQRVSVPSYASGSFEFIPYVAITSDLLKSSTQGNAGVDVFWSPNSNHKLAATLNPDFGQVESDELVVNFTAIETFFTEKRPFFTAGTEIFDVRTPHNGKLVHTRRIGAAPDAGHEAATEILGAFKYSGSTDAHEFGVFGALEDDSYAAEGRSYGVARWIRKGETINTGYLATITDRPTLDRQAQVHAVDFDWRLASGLTLRGQGIGSWITQPDEDGHRSTVDGAGGWLDLQYKSGGSWQQYVKTTYFNRDLNFNDVGYQERAALIDLESYTSWDRYDHPETSPLASSAWELWWTAARNDHGTRLRGFAAFSRFLKYRTGATLYLTYRYVPAGIDDLVTQGNGDVRLPSWSRLRAIYNGPQGGRVRLNGQLHVYQEGVSGIAEQAILESKWILAERLSMGLDVNYIHSDDWLAWREDGLASYKRDQLYGLLGIDWYPHRRQEVRVRLQWIGLSAEVNDTYTVGPRAQLLRDSRPGSDFSVSSLGLQIRYRYEFKPLSELFVVYSRGGDVAYDTMDTGFGEQLRRSWTNKTAHQLMMKVRYQF
jgi:hypothetical protein